MKTIPFLSLLATMLLISPKVSAQSISAGAYRTAIIEDGNLLLYGLSLVWSPDIPTWDYLSSSNLDRLYNNGLLVDSGVVSVAAGDDHLLYIKEDSSLWGASTVSSNGAKKVFYAAAFLWNPLIPVELLKTVWIVFDILAGAAFLYIDRKLPDLSKEQPIQGPLPGGSSQVEQEDVSVQEQISSDSDFVSQTENPGRIRIAYLLIFGQ